MSIKIGSRIEYTGENASPYFTNGQQYEVLGESGPDMWYITDNGGTSSNGGNGHCWLKRDILESFRLLPQGPVRTETVTRRRIVPGVYGQVTVDTTEQAYVRLSLTRELFNAEELDSLAMVASQLAEALRDE